MSMIHDITAKSPRYKKRIRKGRGESSGRGKTCGRGTKGAGARVGTYIKRGHEGGQTPIYRRFPTRGFSNENFERNWYIVNVADLDRFQDGSTVDANALIVAGLVPDTKDPVKILGDGNLAKRLTVMAGWYSKSAHAKILAAGGSPQNVKGEPFEFPKPKPKFVLREPAKKKQAPAEAAPAAAGEKPEQKKREPPADAAGPAPAPPAPPPAEAPAEEKQA